MSDELSADEQESLDRAPKFHTDRTHYATALGPWFAEKLEQPSLEIADLDIPVATGFSNETVIAHLKWLDNGAERQTKYVVRIEPSGGALFPKQTPALNVSAEVQYRIMAAVEGRSAAPVPPLAGYEADATLLGQPFFAMEFVDGVVPADTPRYSEAGFLVDEATPEQRRHMVTAGLRAMGELHSIDWKEAGLEWLDRTGGSPSTAEQLKIYRQATTEWLDGREHPVLDAAFDWLGSNMPDDDRIGISWGDSRMGNIIWQNYEPAAVVDWEAVALSPTEADVGWWLMFDRMSFEDLGAERMEGFPTREEMVDIYQEASGREVYDPHYWEVFGAMRFDAIFIGLADRMTDAGLMPPEMSMAVANQVTDALAALLGMENPTPSKF